MATQSTTSTFNQFAHGAIDLAVGMDSSRARANFNDKASKYEKVGLITMVASAVIVATFTFSLISLLAVGTFLVGREIYLIGKNSKEVVNNPILRGAEHLAGSTLSKKEFDTVVSDNTWLMKGVVKHIGAGAITNSLHQGYLDTRRVN